MNSWKTFQASVTQAASQAAGAAAGAAASVDLNSTGTKLSRGFATFQQTVKEKTGGVGTDDITELPQEYLDLERRVDGLRTAHLNLLKVAKSYEGAYDYPVHINESVAEIGGSLAHNLSYWAAAATKGECFVRLSTGGGTIADLVCIQEPTSLSLPSPKFVYSSLRLLEHSTDRLTTPSRSPSTFRRRSLTLSRAPPPPEQWKSDPVVSPTS